MSIDPKLSVDRPSRLDNAPLDYAPNNELGVVFLFSDLARRRYGLRVERVQAGFPDCVAYRGTKRIRIEFEYRARNFVTHGHDPKGCDWIVCWINDWLRCPETIHVVELRREYGLGFNTWIVPIAGDESAALDAMKHNPSWSAPSAASEGT
jgi:hypothetical protein